MAKMKFVLLGVSALTALAFASPAYADSSPDANAWVTIGNGFSVDGGAVGATSGLAGNQGDVSIGSFSQAKGSVAGAGHGFATAVGTGASATGDGAAAYGFTSMANGQNSTAIGTGANAFGFSTAIGSNSKSTATGGTAVGINSLTNDHSTALGDTAKATGTAATALGSSSFASATSATAVGDTAWAIAANSTAVGQFTCNNTANTFTVGNDGTGSCAGAFQRRITNVAAGINGFDAVNMNQLNAEASARVAGDAATLASSKAYTDAQINNLDDNLSNGIAAAGALEVITPSAPGRTTVHLAWGNYNGQNAYGGTIAHKFGGTMPIVIDAGVASGTGGSSDVLARAGVGFEF